MGDSDDDHDNRHNRDKFRRERDGFNGNRMNINRNSGEWNDGRDRSNQFRRQHLSGREFISRFNRSPARYDLSPPQNKRIRHDWDNLDQPSSHFDSNYFNNGGNIPEQLNKESSDIVTQPVLLSFKNFLLSQDDNIDQEEAVKRYNTYKIDFRKTQIVEFFTAHKDETWFKYKYHPDEYQKRFDEQRQIIKKRLEIFMDLYNKGYLNDISIDIEHQRELLRFLDAATIKMEGGTDDDLRILDDNESEVPNTPRLLHRTSSIFFRHLPMQTTKDDIENICKQYAGFRRVCITDPAPEKKFSRRAWATFDHTVQIRNICYELNLTKLHDVDINTIINRELKNRIRTINGIGKHKKILRNDLQLIIKLIKKFDERWNIWKSIDNENKVNETNLSISDDSEISSSTTTNISSMKDKNSISYNPLLKNLTEYLVDDGNVEDEDEELLDNNSNKSQITKILDRLILYLRIVYSFDYYNISEYSQEDSMPNRCGVIHVRGLSLSSITQNELTNYMKQFEERLKPYIDYNEKLDDNEALKLGAKNEQDEVEKFMNDNCQEVAKDKWSCPLSGKKFKAPEFVRKHILNKHQDKIDEVKKDVIYFNNYLYDPKRPQLPEQPANQSGTTSSGLNSSGLPLPTPMTAQPLLTRPPIWPAMHPSSHPNPSGYYPNQFQQPRHLRPPFLYQNVGSLPHRGPNNRQLKSYEDLDAPNES